MASAPETSTSSGGGQRQQQGTMKLETRKQRRQRALAVAYNIPRVTKTIPDYSQQPEGRRHHTLVGGVGYTTLARGERTKSVRLANQQMQLEADRPALEEETRSDAVLARLCRACGEFIPESEPLMRGHETDVFHARCFQCACCSVPFSDAQPFFTSPTKFRPWRPRYVRFEDLEKPHPYMCADCEDREDDFHAKFRSDFLPSEAERLAQEFGGAKPRVCDLTKKLPALEGPLADATFRRQELLLVNKTFDIQVDPAAVICKVCDQTLQQVRATSSADKWLAQTDSILRDAKHAERILRHEFICLNCDRKMDEDARRREEEAAADRAAKFQKEEAERRLLQSKLQASTAPPEPEPEVLAARREELQRLTAEMQGRDAEREKQWLAAHVPTEDQLLIALERAPHVLQGYVLAKQETHEHFQRLQTSLLENANTQIGAKYTENLAKDHSVLYCEVETEQLRFSLAEQVGLLQQQSRDAKDALIADYQAKAPPPGPPAHPAEDARLLDTRMDAQHLILEGDYVELLVAKKSYKYGTIFPVGSKAVVRRVLYNVPIRGQAEDENALAASSQRDEETRLASMRQHRAQRREELMMLSQKGLAEQLEEAKAEKVQRRQGPRVKIPFRGEMTSKDYAGTVSGEAEVSLQEIFETDVKEVYYEGSRPPSTRASRRAGLKNVQRAYLLSFLPPGLDPRNPDSFNPFRPGFPEQYKGHGIFRDLEWYCGDGLYLDGGKMNKQFLTKNMWVRKVDIQKYAGAWDPVTGGSGVQPLFRPLGAPGGGRSSAGPLVPGGGGLTLENVLAQLAAAGDGTSDPVVNNMRASELMRYIVQPWQAGPDAASKPPKRSYGVQYDLEEPGRVSTRSAGVGPRERSVIDTLQELGVQASPAALEVLAEQVSQVLDEMTEDGGGATSKNAVAPNAGAGAAPLPARQSGAAPVTRESSSSAAAAVVDEIMALPAAEVPDVLAAVEEIVQQQPEAAAQVLAAVEQRLSQPGDLAGGLPPAEIPPPPVARRSSGRAAAPGSNQGWPGSNVVPQGPPSGMGVVRAPSAAPGSQQSPIMSPSNPSVLRNSSRGLKQLATPTEAEKVSLRPTTRNVTELNHDGIPGERAMSLRTGAGQNEYSPKPSVLEGMPNLRPTDRIHRSIDDEAQYPRAHSLRPVEVSPNASAIASEQDGRRNLSLRSVFPKLTGMMQQRPSATESPFHNAPALKERFLSLKQSLLGKDPTADADRNGGPGGRRKWRIIALMGAAMRGLGRVAVGIDEIAPEQATHKQEANAQDDLPSGPPQMRNQTLSGDAAFVPESLRESMPPDAKITVRERIRTNRGVVGGSVRQLATQFEERDLNPYPEPRAPRSTRASVASVGNTADGLAMLAGALQNDALARSSTGSSLASQTLVADAAARASQALARDADRPSRGGSPILHKQLTHGAPSLADISAALDEVQKRSSLTSAERMTNSNGTSNASGSGVFSKATTGLLSSLKANAAKVSGQFAKLTTRDRLTDQRDRLTDQQSLIKMSRQSPSPLPHADVDADAAVAAFENQFAMTPAAQAAFAEENYVQLAEVTGPLASTNAPTSAAFGGSASAHEPVSLGDVIEGNYDSGSPGQLQGYNPYRGWTGYYKGPALPGFGKGGGGGPISAGSPDYSAGNGMGAVAAAEEPQSEHQFVVYNNGGYYRPGWTGYYKGPALPGFGKGEWGANWRGSAAEFAFQSGIDDSVDRMSGATVRSGTSQATGWSPAGGKNRKSYDRLLDTTRTDGGARASLQSAAGRGQQSNAMIGGQQLLPPGNYSYDPTPFVQADPGSFAGPGSQMGGNTDLSSNAVDGASPANRGSSGPSTVVVTFSDGHEEAVANPAGVYEYASSNLWWRITVLPSLESWLNYGYYDSREAAESQMVYHEGECSLSLLFVSKAAVEFTLERVDATDSFRRSCGQTFLVACHPETGELLPDKARMLQLLCDVY
ncbi:unnamed protein product [Amoebophrya sp. A120]|nr:unnamed protein product [Amoebophrya sp. A120]|eukprot:GSA120T00011765001.1